MPALSSDMPESAVRSMRGACRGGVAGSNSMAGAMLAAGDRAPAGGTPALGASAHPYGSRSAGMCSARYGCLSSSARVEAGFLGYWAVNHPLYKVNMRTCHGQLLYSSMQGQVMEAQELCGRVEGLARTRRRWARRRRVREHAAQEVRADRRRAGRQRSHVVQRDRALDVRLLPPLEWQVACAWATPHEHVSPTARGCAHKRACELYHCMASPPEKQAVCGAPVSSS